MIICRRCATAAAVIGPRIGPGDCEVCADPVFVRFHVRPLTADEKIAAYRARGEMTRSAYFDAFGRDDAS